jgi:general secretion pathway protein I
VMSNYKSNVITNSASGFTLLEVMVSLSIIAIALTVLLTSQSQSLSLATEARFDTIAPLLAQSKIAEINTTKKDDLYSQSGDFGDSFPDYFWEMELNSVSSFDSDKYADYLKQIDLSIYYGEDRLFKYNLRLYRFFPDE